MWISRKNPLKSIDGTSHCLRCSAASDWTPRERCISGGFMVDPTQKGGTKCGTTWCQKILPSPNSYQYLNMLEAMWKKNAKVQWWQNDGKLKKVCVCVYIYIYIFLPGKKQWSTSWLHSQSTSLTTVVNWCSLESSMAPHCPVVARGPRPAVQFRPASLLVKSARFFVGYPLIN